MRLAIACLALLAVAAASRGGCGEASSPSYEPCAGKACGDSCSACAPDDRDCVETADVKACDPGGRCATAGSFGCPTPDPCAGKACGDSCNACGTPACNTLLPTACDRRGQCVTVVGTLESLCYDPCAGKSCGDPCTACPPEASAGGCAEILCMKSCDGAAECVCSGSGAACP